MNNCTFDYFYNNIYKINDVYMEEAKIAFKYLSRPAIVYKMITTIEMGLSPLNVVCKPIESLIDCSNIVTRQLVGREMAFILKFYGYKQSEDRERIRTCCKGKYFLTGAKYTRDKNYNNSYRFIVTVQENRL